MKKIFKMMMLAMGMIAMGVSMSSCSGEDEAPANVYVYGLYKMSGQGSVTSGGNNLLNTWLETKIQEYNKTVSGEMVTADYSAVAPNEAKGTEALNNLKKEFDEVLKTHDFGIASINFNVSFQILKSLDVVFEKTLPFVYHHPATSRWDYKTTLPLNVTSNLEAMEDYTEPIYLKLVDFPALDPEAIRSVAVDPAGAKVFNTKTADIYTGEKFLTETSYDESRKAVIINLNYKRAHLADYIGDWYAVIPVVMNGDYNTELKVAISNK